jgi:hypothetical protein
MAAGPAFAAPAWGGRDEGHPRDEYERHSQHPSLVFVVSGDLLPREARRRMRQRGRLFNGLPCRWVAAMSSSGQTVAPVQLRALCGMA